MDKIAEAKRVFDIEIGALEKTRDSLDGTFVKILDNITTCKGKVIITGMGKPGHVGTKIAATLASLGTSSFFLHPAEAMHGDLGMISENDIVIAISYSGESDEIIRIIPSIKLIGAKLIGITGNAESTLAKLYNIPSTGLRFFTVYGPAGRPDMFYYSATKRLVEGEKIQIFNYGDMRRDFTYIDDIVEGILRVMQGAPEKKIGEDGLPLPPYAVYNIGGGQPENLLDFVATLQEELVRAGILPPDYDFEGHRELVGMQPGDVPVTYADSEALERDYGFTPKIGIRQGLRQFAEWYKEYYGV